MPVLLKGSVCVDDRDYAGARIIRDKTLAEVEAVIADYVANGFQEDWDGEFEVIGGWYIHDDDIAEAFSAEEISEDAAQVLESMGAIDDGLVIPLLDDYLS